MCRLRSRPSQTLDLNTQILPLLFNPPRFLCRGQALDDLYAGMVSLILEPSPRPQVDVFIEVGG